MKFVSVCRPETRRARLPRKCGACSETIEPRTTYTRIFFVDDDGAGHVSQCSRCHAIWRAIAARTSDPVLFDLNCGESWRDTFGDVEPPEVAALAFMLPGEAPAD